jgi:hypothetical protein
MAEFWEYWQVAFPNRDIVDMFDFVDFDIDDEQSGFIPCLCTAGHDLRPRLFFQSCLFILLSRLLGLNRDYFRSATFLPNSADFWRRR